MRRSGLRETSLGERAGEPTSRLVRPEFGRDAEPVAEVLGFNVHAKVAIDGRDGNRVERVCRRDRCCSRSPGRSPAAQKEDP